MNSSDTKVIYSSGGVGLSGLAFLVFLVLKLCKVIDWSWWWVTAPLWAPLALFVAISLLAVVVAVVWIIIGNIIDYIEDRKYKRYRRK